MKHKNILIYAAAGIIVLAVVAVLLFVFFRKSEEQADVFSQTNSIAREYVLLRYETDQLLIHAQEYPTYEAWNTEMDFILMRWENLEAHASILQANIKHIQNESSAYRNTAFAAYTPQEIMDIFDSAPPRGTGIRPLEYLAEQLGTDARRAFEILKLAGDQIDAETWDAEGDLFERLQKTAEGIGTSCKIAVYVGGIILTVPATTTVGAIVGGAGLIASGLDLVAEVGETGSKLFAGYNSDAVVIFGDLRKYTTPIAAIIGFGSTFYDYKNWDRWGKVSAIMFGGDQLTSLVVEEKVVGIEIDKIATTILNFSFAPSGKVEAAVLGEEDLREWLSDNNISTEPDDPAIILGIEETAIPKTEPVIVSEEGKELTDEQLAEIEQKKKLQEEMADINARFIADVTACYGQRVTVQAADPRKLEVQKQACVNACKHAADQDRGNKMEVCSTNDSQYPKASKELQYLRNQCRERCKTQYDYLMGLERQYGNDSARIAQLNDFFKICPDMCEKRCIPLQRVSYAECENGCQYAYVKNLQAEAMNIRGTGSPEAAQCKRDVIMRVQSETMRVLQKYGYSIDDF